ncbi:MAG: peptide deformylase [Pseudomonadota bacterium]
MAIKEVLRLGDQRLLRIADPINDITLEQTFLKQLYQDMVDSMKHYGGVGIAAPQIGVNARVILFGFDKNPRYPEEASIPETFLINPTYTVQTEETEAGLEGCLSVPGLRGSVRRFTKIRYSGYSINNEKIERTASGFHARVIQHECDHLDGILYPFKIDDYAQFGFEDLLLAKNI